MGSRSRSEIFLGQGDECGLDGQSGRFGRVRMEYAGEKTNFSF